ncbi:YslB family protein [Niallia sp. 01092]|uniref:YslB family protein n=1 Tax=unclassified Niallia TaxID=2837522 RepID=UPI003FD4D078
MSELTSVEGRSRVDEEPLTVPAYGYELIREILIPDLLGRDTPELLYWAGKRIARMFPLEHIEEARNFFEKAGWGTLEVSKQSKYEMEYTLTSPLIEKRLREKGKCTFQLETGYLAQQHEHLKKVIAEAFEDPKRRDKKITITVRWDSKDPV